MDENISTVLVKSSVFFLRHLAMCFFFFLLLRTYICFKTITHSSRFPRVTYFLSLLPSRPPMFFLETLRVFLPFSFGRSALRRISIAIIVSLSHFSSFLFFLPFSLFFFSLSS